MDDRNDNSGFVILALGAVAAYVWWKHREENAPLTAPGYTPFPPGSISPVPLAVSPGPPQAGASSLAETFRLGLPLQHRLNAGIPPGAQTLVPTHGPLPVAPSVFRPMGV